MAVRRRRWRFGGGLLVLAVAVLLLLGRGLGILPTTGTDPEAEPKATAGERAAAVPPPSPPQPPEPSPQSPVPQSPAPQSAQSPPLPPAVEPVTLPAEPPEPAPSVPADDRAAAMRSLVRAALSEGRIGVALSELETQRTAGSRDVAVELLAKATTARLEAGVQQLCRDVAAGAVLDAHLRLQQLLEPPTTAATQAVQRACAERGWPSFAATAAPPASVPAAQPLSVDRRVRAWLADDQIVQGRLLAQDPAGATLRCAGPAGVTFPQVQPWQLEPEAVMPSEAAELGLAALAAAKPRLARLWCACGLSAARDRVPSRLLELRALLPD